MEARSLWPPSSLAGLRLASEPLMLYLDLGYGSIAECLPNMLEAQVSILAPQEKNVKFRKY